MTPPALRAPRLAGLLLFLFIPVVLFLFVAHPAPIGASVAAGVALMLGHRFLARPYMLAVREHKCLWCNRLLAAGEPGERLAIATAAGPLEARFCPGHALPADRFLSFLGRAKPLLRAGIFLPLLALLGVLVAAALGRDVPVEGTTRLFQLAIGITVNVAAAGALLARPGAPASPFPPHNLFLLGIRNLLWVLRIVGIWWIVRGVLWLAAAMA